MIWVYMKSPVMQQGGSSPVYATQPSIQTYLNLIAYPIYCVVRIWLRISG
jgi:hypothetical protein